MEALTLTKFLDIKPSSKVAIDFPEEDKVYTYSDLHDTIRILSKQLLSLPVERQQNIGLLLPNTPTYIFMYLALGSIGAVSVSLNYLDTNEGLYYAIDCTDIKVLITDSHVLERGIDYSKCPKLETIILCDSPAKSIQGSTSDTAIKVIDIRDLKPTSVSDEELLDVQSQVLPTDLLSILFTSGSTSKPKPVAIEHSRVLNAVKQVQQEVLHYNENDSVLNALPLNHIMGLYVSTVLPLHVGCKINLMSRFKTDKALHIIAEKKCTVIHGVPTLYSYLLNKHQGYNTSSLQKASVAGDLCNKKLVRQLKEELGIEHVYISYGQTEAIPLTQTTDEDTEERITSTVGKPVSNVQIKIVDEQGNELPTDSTGEILAYTPFLMRGYYNDPEATNKTIQDGWLRTGDLGCIDSQGYLVFKGRKKNIIIRGGENISPVEIEDILSNCPVIAEVRVFGVPDEELGQDIAMLFTPTDTTIPNEAAILSCISYINSHLPVFKRPKYVHIIDEFEKTSSGKIVRTNLLEKWEKLRYGRR